MTELKYIQRPVSYEGRLESRKAQDIDLVVIHCTELPDLAMARDYGERICYEQSRTGNSGHFYVDRDGTVERWVDPLRVAHHVRDFNQRSIGIELVNRGRWPQWFASDRQVMHEEYGRHQIESLTQLLRDLVAELPCLKWVAGHEDLDREQVPASDDAEVLVYRKRDPGPLFPWPTVMHATQLKRLTAETQT